jgi:exonuclease SbcC
MTAFGPFAKTETIEFDKLGDNPLFLINGPTGSGKTTILDGICFALYGSTTGNERDARQMRCDQAEADILTQVELVFALHERRYRITRQPDQEKPKAKGGGVTSQSASAELHEIATDGAEQLLVARKVGEANLMIQSLTGLNADQFRQVMVLPQGKFRELLMAKSRDREAIFSQLFQTHIYKHIEDQLKDQAASIRKEVEAQRNQQKGILAATDVENSDALDTELERLQPEHSAAKTAKEEATKQQQYAHEIFRDAQKLAEDFTRLDDAETKLKGLADHKPFIERKRVEQALTEEANSVSAQFNEVSGCSKRLSLATERFEQAHSDKASKEALLEKANKELALSVKRDEPQLDAAKQKIATLEGYRQRMIQLESAQVNKQYATTVLESVTSELLAAQELAQMAKANITQAQAEQTEITGDLSQVTGIQLKLKTQNDQLRLKHEQIVLANKIKQSEVQLSTQQGAVDNATKEFEQNFQNTTRIEIAWHSGQAALLAERLEEKQPCSVCGSTDHPMPALSLEDIPTQDDLNHARVESNEAQDRQNAAKQMLERMKNGIELTEEQLKSIKQKLGAVAVLAIEELEAEHHATQKQAEQHSRQQQRQVALASEIEHLRKGDLDAAKALTDSTEKNADAKTALATAVLTVLNAEQELPDTYRSLDTLESAITASDHNRAGLVLLINKIHDNQKCLNANAKAAGAILHSADQSKFEASEAYTKSLETWQDILRGSNFKDEQQFKLALSGEVELAELKAEISAYDTQCNKVQGAIEDQKKALKGKAKPEIVSLKRKLDEETSARLEAESAFQDIDKRYSRLVHTRNTLNKALSKTVDLETRYALIGTLSDIANGSTGNKISLQRFVLSVLLDDVLLVASTRLEKMSKGRYQLFRNHDRAKGGGASGLDLVVEDAYTGNQRPVATLSGGESFLAALALALGLSDVVQAYAGGIRLDTLFIDEGFGSLDPESLDLAINTLIDLQATGRMIGIISHVPELKEWMNVRLDVIADRSGSYTVAVLP